MTVADSSGSIGPYRIVQPLAPGGWGRAYVCMDPVSGSKVIVRVVDCREEAWVDEKRGEVIDDLNRLATFRRPDVLSLQRVEPHGDELWIVSEYVDGTPLRTHLAAHKPTVLDVLDILEQVSRVLADARAQQLPAIEISPANIWVRGRRDVRVMILPAAWRLMHAAPGYVAGAGPIEHRPEYTSPDFLAWRVIDERTDVFELGSLLYEATSGRKPFEGEDPREVRERVRSGTFAPVSLPDPAERTAVNDVIARALSTDPAKRFQTVGELADALRAARDNIAANTPAGDLLDTAVLVDRLNPPRSAADVSEVAAALPPAPFSASEIAATDAPSRALDDNVQFTVFRPKSLVPTRWYTMLVFAHLSEARPDARPEEPDPVQEVQRQAEAILGGTSAHSQQTVDSLDSVPRQGELTVVPHAEGIEFNPASRAFRWTESVHREEFRLRAHAALAPGVVRGRVSVYLGSIVIADIALALKIEREAGTQTDAVTRESVRPYRRIFASYSHRDRAIVDEYAEYARAIGDRYLQDVIDLRSGERWQPALAAMIDRADVFQLFWSWNALRSEYVTREWQYALGLRRPAFIRPVYWDEPMPAAEGLPPSTLRELHFERIRPRHGVATVVPHQTSAPASAQAPPPPAPPSPPPPAPPRGAAPAPMPEFTPSAPAHAEAPTTSSGAGPAAPRAPKQKTTTVIARHRPRPSTNPAPPAATLASRWRIYTAVAAAVLAIVVTPMLYVGMRSSGTITDRPTAAPTSEVPPPTSATARAGSERDIALSIRSADGSRAPAVTVELFRAGSQVPAVTATTDRSGAATLKRVSPGSYRVVISTQGQRLAETHVDVERGRREQPLQIDLPAEALAK